MLEDRYGSDVLAAGWREKGKKVSRPVPAELDLVVEVAGDGWCGAITGVEAGNVELEDRKGRRRSFPLGAGFLIDGEPVRLEKARKQAQGRTRTASGSFVSADGKHDAELVEKVWGADLRAEGVAVEFLQGLDLLEELLETEPPSAARRYGVLVDHLVDGSKEDRIARRILAGPHGRHLKIVGHPFIDVWQCVRPAAMGIRAWPVVPRGQDWKTGICRGLGWPAETKEDIGLAWQRILSRVTTFRDLEPTLLGRVEELIDFVTVGE